MTPEYFIDKHNKPENYDQVNKRYLYPFEAVEQMLNEFSEEKDKEIAVLKAEVFRFAYWVESSETASQYDRKNRLRFEPKMGGNPELNKRIPELYELFKKEQINPPQ